MPKSKRSKIHISNENYLFQLPFELIFQIVNYIDFQSLWLFLNSCQYLKQILDSNHDYIIKRLAKAGFAIQTKIIKSMHINLMVLTTEKYSNEINSVEILAELCMRKNPKEKFNDSNFDFSTVKISNSKWKSILPNPKISWDFIKSKWNLKRDMSSVMRSPNMDLNFVKKYYNQLKTNTSFNHNILKADIIEYLIRKKKITKNMYTLHIILSINSNIDYKFLIKHESTLKLYIEDPILLNLIISKCKLSELNEFLIARPNLENQIRNITKRLSIYSIIGMLHKQDLSLFMKLKNYFDDILITALHQCKYTFEDLERYKINIKSNLIQIIGNSNLDEKLKLELINKYDNTNRNCSKYRYDILTQYTSEEIEMCDDKDLIELFYSNNENLKMKFVIKHFNHFKLDLNEDFISLNIKYDWNDIYFHPEIKWNLFNLLSNRR